MRSTASISTRPVPLWLRHCIAHALPDFQALVECAADALSANVFAPSALCGPRGASIFSVETRWLNGRHLAKVAHR